ncbi:MAG: cytochrome C [Gammaproteobacteria bacterium]|nr:cytochrome C [Gammaproteobacteria bacterium]
MKYRTSLRLTFLLIASALFSTACSDKALHAPAPPASVKKVAANWSADQAQRIAQKTQYIKDNQSAFDWFSDFAFSESDGTPYIILRLLPVIAPELWGSDDNFLSVVGLFNDTRQNAYPMPRGIGISALNREKPLGDIDYTSFTCAACHIGRVKKASGEIVYIDGGINTEFNIVLYRVKVYQTLQKIIGEESDKNKQQQLIIDAFLSALEKAKVTSNTFFYRNYQNPWLNLDAAYEKAQISLFTDRAAELISAFATRAIANYTGYGALLDKNYKGFQSRSLQGFPGMADATGIFTVNSYNAAQDNFFTRLFASYILPDSPGITDIMSVWQQHERKAEWDASHKTLINGGGQWNGNIPIPMYRNLAAQSTLGLDDIDIRVSAFAVDLLDKLPASVYPFELDVELAKQGEALFSKNCAQCHQPHNGKVYDNLNVNLDRSYVVNWLIRRGGISGFNDTCSPSTRVVMDKVVSNPCATFDGVSLKGKKDLIISPNDQHHGYNARPLSGIWAQAPYLHNGSVPTVYHLLMPDERPLSFFKSRLEYDQQKLGFAWTAPSPAQLPLSNSYIFDSNSFPAFSNAGHDTDIIENGQRYKLNWSDDKAGAMAIIEYLKTL